MAEFTSTIATRKCVALIFGHTAVEGPIYRGALVASNGVSTLQLLGWEALITGLFAMSILYSTGNKGLPKFLVLLLIWLGLALVIIIGAPITGGATNPARALAPMVISGMYLHSWVYVVGPSIGGLVATFLFTKFSSR